MTQQMDIYGDPLDGGKLYFFVAGTVSTPQNAYKDGLLTLEHPNPITLDASGRVPQLFLADGLIKIRLTDAAGVVHLVADNIAVIGASSGEAIGGAIDATTIFQTGDLKPRYGTGPHEGWVRCNKNTIGSSVSGASELADNDTQALFEYLWQFTTIDMGDGDPKGATANADWLANRTLVLPDLRGRTLAGLDDMGSEDGTSGRLTEAYFDNDPTLLGEHGGEQNTILVQGNLPNASLAVTVSSVIIPAGQGSHGHTLGGNSNLILRRSAGLFGSANDGGAGSLGDVENFSGAIINNTLPALSGSGSGTAALGGSSLPVSRVPPMMVVTIYIKL
jgi:hypothetical protein